jgi:hypothetical protein
MVHFAAVLACVLPIVYIAGYPAANENHTNASIAAQPEEGQRSRIGLRFNNLCNDVRKICGTCTSAAGSPGLFAHEYAVVELSGGAPDTWENHQQQCIMEGVLNADNKVYR